MYSENSPILDFTVVNTHNPYTIGIADTSLYPTNFSIANPTYEIKPPSFPKAVVEFPKNDILVLNSNNLNITCVDNIRNLMELPDGIWTITQTISPAITYNVEKSFLRTVQIEQRFGNAFLKTDLVQCDKWIKDNDLKILNQANFYIQAAIAAGNQCNMKLAMDLYRAADKIITNFLKGNC